MTVRRFLVAAIVASMAPTLTVAQSIRGTVIDSVSGKPVASARVAVYNTAFQTVADSLGRFAFSDVPAGDRALTIHTASLDSLSASYTVPVTVSGATTIAVRVPSALQIAAWRAATADTEAAESCSAGSESPTIRQRRSPGR